MCRNCQYGSHSCSCNSPLLYCYTFPIPNYENNGIYEQNVFIYSCNSPTKDQVISILDKAEAQECTWERDHLDWGPFTHPYAACIEAINQIRENGEFPILRGALVQTNTFCETSFGRYPLSVQRINPFIISQDGSISTKL